MGHMTLNIFLERLNLQGKLRIISHGTTPLAYGSTRLMGRK
jgi:hypothetical protein